MPDPQRVEFVTRHFGDLQTIRFAPVPALMLLAPLLAGHDVRHLSKLTAWGILLSLLFCVVGFGWWSTVVIKRRYGSVKPSSVEALRMRRHPAIVALIMIALATMSWFYIFGPSRYGTYVYFAFVLLSAMLRIILDSTNPVSRRVVWAIGLVALYGAGPFLIRSESAAIFFLGGVVWLSISTFDFLLLRRTLAEISAPPPSGVATEVVAHYG